MIVPLSARIFDLSIGYTMSLTGIICAHGLIVSNQSLGLCLLLALGASLLVGILNGIVVVVFRIDSFIGTLGTGSLVAAFTLYVSGGSTLTGAQLGRGFAKIYSAQIFGLTAPVYYAFALAVILWLLLEHTPPGAASTVSDSTPKRPSWPTSAWRGCGSARCLSRRRSLDSRAS